MAQPSLRELTRPAVTALLLQEVRNGVAGTATAVREVADAAASVRVISSCARLAVAARDELAAAWKG